MLRETGLILVNILFNFYILIVLLRFFLQWVRADFYNPLTQLVTKLALPVVWPLQKIIPTWRNINFAALTGVLILETLKIMILLSIGALSLPHWLGAIIWACGDAINHAANLFFFAILAQVLLSWLRPQGGNPLLEIIYRLTQPLLKPFHRFIPPIGGLDLTPIPVIILLKLISFYIAYPIMAYGLTLT